jgi:hypothetical protein
MSQQRASRRGVQSPLGLHHFAVCHPDYEINGETVHPKMDAPKDSALIPTPAKTLEIGFAKPYVHAKPCFNCDNV